jgi:hypothetical protein
MTDNVELAGLIYVAIEVCKSAGMPARYAGLAAIALGALLALALRAEPSAVIDGALAGLVAAGTYSGVRAVTAKHSTTTAG